MKQITLDANAIAPAQRGAAGTHEVAPDVAYLRTLLANVVFLGPQGAGDGGWVLIDAGIGGFAGAIQRAAYGRFGPRARPAAIVLTHGHFDHVGSLRPLLDAWDVPVFAHSQEFPHLTGEEAYPPADPLVGGGLMALSGKAASAQSHRHPRELETATGRWRRTFPTPMDVGAYTGPHARPCVALAGVGPDGDRRRRVYHDQAGVALGRPDAAGGSTRSADVLHRGLAGGR